MTALTDLTLREAAARVAARDVSPVELTQACLDRAAATEPAIHAFSSLLADSALAEARAVEAAVAKGEAVGPLAGVPVGIKELYDVAGEPTTASSKQRTDWVADSDSASVAQLRGAGAVILGKTHTHEFAFGIVTPESRNPWDTGRIPGGSSGGSGAAVAAGSCFMGMGSDTGGSIRIPAALCGVVGLKPTYGRCSRAGVTSLSWALDHVGPLTRSVGDAALCLNVLAGYDARDPGSVDVPAEDYTQALGGDVKGLRIGVPTTYFFDRVDPQLAAGARAALAALEGEGAILREVAIPYAEQILAVEYAICLAEASEYHRAMLRDAPDLYNDDVRLFLEAGEMIPATRYIQALRVRQLMQRAWAEMFDAIDVLIGPAVTMPAVPVGQMEVDWGDGFVEALNPVYVRLSAPANVTGLPSVSVPCGFTEAGLPMSIQIMARPFAEATALRVADAYERMTGFAARRPPL